MASFLAGTAVIALGVACIYFNKQLEKGFGRNQRAETNLGGTYAMYVLIGFAIIVLGILMRFGLKIGNPTDI